MEILGLETLRLDENELEADDFWGKEGLEPYQYTPISPGEIRCLVLEPGHDNEPLSCTLEVHQIADKPDYEAISYVWGTPVMCHKIKCHGRQTSITRNLRDVLRQCRLPDSTRVLWADSVCINQNDDREKSHQVSVMGKIYSQATRVLICLGSDQTDGCAQQLQSLVHDFNRMFQRTLEKITDDYDSFPFPDDDDPLLSDPRWQSCVSLEKHTWNDRGWVVQEAGLAKDALLLWGKAQIPWLWLLRIITWIRRRSNLRSTLGELGLGNLHVNMYKSHYSKEARTMFRRSNFITYDLLSMLNAARSLHVTDNRDRIYAFLGLPTAADIRDSISIDYEKTASQVYQDFACHYLDHTQDLSLLHYVQPNEAAMSEDPEYPSWVPQWHWNFYINHLYRTYDTKILSQYDPRAVPCSRVGGSILRVRGLILDSITYLSPCLSESTTIDDLAAIWKAVICHRSRPIYEKFPPIYAFLETIRIGVYPTILSNEELKELTEAYLRRLDPDASVLGGEDAKAPPDAADDGPNGPEDFLWDWIVAPICNRHVAVTERGYYCLVPKLAREGDTCALIFGTAHPFILHSTGSQGYYKVVGDAFMTSSREIDLEACVYPYRVGVDDGVNAYEDWQDWALEEEDIWLC